MDGFQVICEVEPPTRPDLKKVRHQIGVMSPIADAFLIPDNHIGRATVSSVAVANEVQLMGARGIACLNSRDRNLLGFRRDLLTAARLGKVPGWKAEADFLYLQVSFDVDELLRWRDSIALDIPVYAGVMVLASAKMAHDLASVPQLTVPDRLVEAVERDRDAGVEAACDQVLRIRDSGAFDGVHLIPVSRYRQVAARLEPEL